MIAATCANVVPNIAGKITASKSYKPKLIIATATRPQCRPKITKTCQIKPINNPDKSGENAWILPKTPPTKFVKILTIGPTKRRPMGP